MIQPIVEGHGEVDAVPVLIRRLAAAMDVHALQIGRPIRRPRSRLMTREGIEQAGNLARARPGCHALLFIFDADDACPKQLAPTLDEWVRELSQPLHARLIMANKEYEAWLLPPEWEGEREKVRDAKGRLERTVSPTFRYDERTDQPAMTQTVDLAFAYEKCRSFRKLVKEVHSLLGLMGLNPSPWPQ